MWKSFLIIKNEIGFDELIGFQELNFIKTIEISTNGKYIGLIIILTKIVLVLNILILNMGIRYFV